MKRKDFLDWAARLTELDDTQIQNLYDRLNQLGKKPNGSIHVENDPEDWLWPGLVHALKSKGLLSTSAIPALKNGKGYKRYLEHSPQVRERLIRLVGVGDIRARDTLAHIAGKALILWCERKRLPESPGVIISMVPHTKEALELQFPGYIDAKLFQLVLGNLDERVGK